jgi:hypothetical protein
MAMPVEAVHAWQGSTGWPHLVFFQEELSLSVGSTQVQWQKGYSGSSRLLWSSHVSLLSLTERRKETFPTRPVGRGNTTQLEQRGKAHSAVTVHAFSQAEFSLSRGLRTTRRARSQAVVRCSPTTCRIRRLVYSIRSRKNKTSEFWHQVVEQTRLDPRCPFSFSGFLFCPDHSSY